MARTAALIMLLALTGCDGTGFDGRATLPNYQPPLQNLPSSHDIQPRNSLPP